MDPGSLDDFVLCVYRNWCILDTGQLSICGALHLGSEYSLLLDPDPHPLPQHVFSQTASQNRTIRRKMA